MYLHKILRSTLHKNRTIFAKLRTSKLSKLPMFTMLLQNNVQYSVVLSRWPANAFKMCDIVRDVPVSVLSK